MRVEPVAPAMSLSTFRRAQLALRRYGIPGLARMTMRRLAVRHSPVLTSRVEGALHNARGLEVGGPTTYLFGRTGYLPVYPLAARIDNVNFAANRTTWENVVQGESFVFDSTKPPGTQYVAEATALHMLADQAYDFVLSSHTIEHTANPLLALSEWRRVLRPSGYLILVAPDPTRTFDRHRPITALSHLVEDAERGTPESDLTHLDDVVAHHDLSLDPWAPQDRVAFAERCAQNLIVRCLHHHVFNLELLRSAVELVGFRVIASERALPDHLILVAEAVATPALPWATRAENASAPNDALPPAPIADESPLMPRPG